MRNILLLLLLAAPCSVPAQSALEPYATRYRGLGALAPGFTTADAQEHNPAAIAALEKPSATLSSEQRFLLPALSNYRFHGTLPLRGGGAGLGMAFGGNPDWRELSLRGSYARRLGTRASVGISIEWMRAGSNAYGHAGALLASAGLRWELAPGVYGGVHLQNPARVRLGKEGEERLPARAGIGLAWQGGTSWLLAADFTHRSGQPPALLAGAEYVLLRKLRARCGIDSAGPAAWLGAGTQAAGLRLDVTVTLHRQLGATPALTLIYPAQ
ncbi:hypothetical protein [Flaviaesturariibacter aridisoli]|uniref:Type IX secretion system membrane protein PorP/SprF n=1 Tax=Flaviaesturariibacter aridisoli TaxID=2545761 RepID=A0A4V6P696_9BACT|nr:hypothetical protein [Flaviaesturariibacter aridisoli]TCZ75022.1 hypothetical protein E0486_01580 [Flaviaesturariibacter aridisoli]